jgi:hypothetical protein
VTLLRDSQIQQVLFVRFHRYFYHCMYFYIFTDKLSVQATSMTVRRSIQTFDFRLVPLPCYVAHRNLNVLKLKVQLCQTLFLCSATHATDNLVVSFFSYSVSAMGSPLCGSEFFLIRYWLTSCGD